MRLCVTTSGGVLSDYTDYTHSDSVSDGMLGCVCVGGGRRIIRIIQTIRIRVVC